MYIPIRFTYLKLPKCFNLLMYCRYIYKPKEYILHFAPLLFSKISNVSFWVTVSLTCPTPICLTYFFGYVFFDGCRQAPKFLDFSVAFVFGRDGAFNQRPKTKVSDNSRNTEICENLYLQPTTLTYPVGLFTAIYQFNSSLANVNVKSARPKYYKSLFGYNLHTIYTYICHMVKSFFLLMTESKEISN